MNLYININTKCCHSHYVLCNMKLIMIVFIDLYEGLKRAQRSRLEDQRGTEINFELPDFLKVNKMKFTCAKV